MRKLDERCTFQEVESSFDQCVHFDTRVDHSPAQLLSCSVGVKGCRCHLNTRGGPANRNDGPLVWPIRYEGVQSVSSMCDYLARLGPSF